MFEIMAEINPAMLLYARKHRHMSLATAAADIVYAEDLARAERGEIQISFVAFHELADRYRYNTTFFYRNHLPTFRMRYHWWLDRWHTRILRYWARRWQLDL
jgi:hypothetical protein